MKYVDLRSDTVTKPSPEMLDVMLKAKVGDDVFEEDPTVNALERELAELCGMEAGLFCSSGTQTNQIAIKLHTQPGDEVICHKDAHVYKYEGGGIGMNSGCSVRLLEGNRGRLQADQIQQSINEDNVHFPRTSLVCLEDTANRGGGAIYNWQDVLDIRDLCHKEGLPLHLDGARYFNAHVERNLDLKAIGEAFDTVSICLSKGLGAPIGSVLLGSEKHIKQARRIRKVWGGGMRQAGFIAAAGLYAVQHNVERLKEDHARAKKLGTALEDLSYIEEVLPVETNIVVFHLKNTTTKALLDHLETQGVKAVPFGPNSIRMVTHLDVNDTHIETTIQSLRSFQP